MDSYLQRIIVIQHSHGVHEIRLLTSTTLMLLLCACSPWTGNLREYDEIRPWNDAPENGVVWFQEPSVIDNDEEGDFKPLLTQYTKDLRRRMAITACTLGAFSDCLITPSPQGATHTIETNVKINNYRRADAGSNIGPYGEILLPPLIGPVWQSPEVAGQMDMTIEWILKDASGNTIAEALQEYSGPAFDFPGRSKNYLPRFQEFLALGTKTIESRRNPSSRVETESFTSQSKKAKTPSNTRAENFAAPVVAVFDIEDHTGILKSDFLSQLTIYLSTKLTQISGYSVIPRDELRSRLAAEQNKSYQDNCDQSCKIEMGLMLAANKSLSTQIIRLGNVCAITADMYDLRTHTASIAASADSECSEEALVKAIRSISEQLKSR